MAEKGSESEDQTEEPDSEPTEEDPEQEHPQQHLAPVKYSPRKNPYPFYINEDFMEKQQKMMLEENARLQQEQKEQLLQK